MAENLIGALKGMVDIRLNVLLAEAVQKTCVVHHDQWLRVDAGEHKHRPVAQELFVQIIQRFEARGIEYQHVPHAQNQHLGGFLHAAQGVLKLIDGGKKKRSVNL